MIKRRELFSSLASFTKRGQGSFIVRPPYFYDENGFSENCIKCDGECASVCDEGIITIQNDRTPVLDFSKGGCTYCDKCAEICGLGVLSVEHKQEIKAKITIDMLECISWHNTMCFSCKELCMEDAIVYLGLFRPEIDMQKCTNCGF